MLGKIKYNLYICLSFPSPTYRKSLDLWLNLDQATRILMNSLAQPAFSIVFFRCERGCHIHPCDPISSVREIARISPLIDRLVMSSFAPNLRVIVFCCIQTWAEAGFGFTKPAFLGSRLRLQLQLLRFWEPGFGFVTFRGFGFVVYQSFYFANQTFWFKTHLVLYK